MIYKNRKPIIGVVPLYDDEKESIWMLPAYLDAISKCGGVPITFPLECDGNDVQQICELCDGFLLTGGHDVDPLLYDSKISDKCGEINRHRDELEKQIFSYAVKNDMSVFGICRGIQIINVLCGGSLYQDLPSEFDSSVSHVMKPPYHLPVHSVDICDGTLLSELYNQKTVQVNSYHHQAVKDLGSGLTAMSYSCDGLVEAVRMKDKKFIVAVQWHPEFSYKHDKNAIDLFSEFIKSCK